MGRPAATIAVALVARLHRRPIFNRNSWRAGADDDEHYVYAVAL
jgi:hypothetical protein